MPKPRLKESHTISASNGFLDKVDGKFVLEFEDGRIKPIAEILDKFVGCYISLSVKEEKEL